MLGIPPVPEQILARGKNNSQEGLIISEGQHTLFVEREEYPPEGGVLVYKFGGVIKPIVIDPAKYEKSGQECLSKLDQLLRDYDMGLVGSDGKPVTLIPNEIIRAENNQEILNKVPLHYPEKGFPDPLAISLANQVKKVLKNELYFFGYKWTMIAFFPFIFLPYSVKIGIVNRWLDGWSYFAKKTMESRLMLPKYYRAFTRELYPFVSNFLIRLGIKEDVAYRTGWMVAEIIERDFAYCIRFEDLAEETSPLKIVKNPRQEATRLLEIFKVREKRSTKLPHSFKAVVNIFKALTYIPKFRKALNETLLECNFQNFRMDMIDKHTAIKMEGYDFFGIPYEVRKYAFMKSYNWNPPMFSYLHSK